MKRLLIITQKIDEQDQLLGFFISWIQRFATRFDKVLVLCLQMGSYPNLGNNVEVVSMGKENGNSKIAQLINFLKFIVVRRGEYDYVFVHMNPIWAAIGGLVWRIMGKRTHLWYTHKAVTLKLRIAHFFADAVFTASAESFRIPSNKVIVTGHGIDTDLFAPNPARKSSRFSILSVGRIAPVKNYDVLIDAVKILSDEGLNFKVTIVGEPALGSDLAYYEKIRSKVDNLGLGNIISFIGKKQGVELVEQYQSHDLFVHMSKTGSLDKTILEAMACGMKVVSSNDASRGFLKPESVFNEDDPESLAKTIRRSAANPLSSNLRDYVAENHNIEDLVSNISQIIK